MKKQQPTRDGLPEPVPWPASGRLLELLYEHLKARGVVFFEPPHEEPWERSMRAHDPDGYTVEFAEGRRGHRGVT
jgi:hypothetical protein